jgi:hypothetical protein
VEEWAARPMCVASRRFKLRKPRREIMSPRTFKTIALALGLASSLLLSCAPVASAGDACCGNCWSCPPPYVHCQVGPPKLKFKHACPLPVCGPCDLKHFGYYPTCWAPYPYPQDYSCCPPAPFGPAVACPAGLPVVGGMPAAKLPEADFSQATAKTSTQVPPVVPAAIVATPSASMRPSPYNPSPEYVPGRER